MAEQCAWYENNYKLIEWEACLNELEQRLCMDILQNKQVVMQSRCFLQFIKKKVEKEELQKRLIEIIGYTIPLKCVMKPGEKFLSREERTVIRNIGILFTGAAKDNLYMPIIEEICEQDEGRSDVRVHIRKYEFLMSAVIDSLGEAGEYDKSSELAARLIRKSLIHRRSGMIARELYNNLWNEQKKSEQSSMWEKHYKCILLSKFNKRENLIHFFEKKLDNI